MKGRVGEHHAHGLEPVGDARKGRDAFARTSFEKDDRVRGGREKRPVFVRDEGEAFGRGEPRRHDREGLFVALLSLAQRRDRLRVFGVARKMKAAEPLDRDDFAGLEGLDRFANRVARKRRAVGGNERQLRAGRRGTQWAAHESGG